MEKKKGGLKSFVITLAVILFSVIFFIIKVLINSTPTDDLPSFTPILIGVVFVACTGYCIYVIFFSKDSFYRKKRLEKKAQNGRDRKTIAQIKTSEQNEKNALAYENKRTSWLLIVFGVFAFIGLLLGAFYWFEYRPTQIRKECSSVKVVIPEVKMITTDDVKNSEISNENCKNKMKEEDPTVSSLDLWYCDAQYPILKQASYEPSREEYRNATDKEYENCLRNKGL